MPGRRIRDFCIPSSSNAYRPGIFGRRPLIFLLALILFAEGFLIASLLSRPFAGDFLALVVGSEIVALTNKERAPLNIGDLTENPLLRAAAQAKAEDMAKGGYFSHTGPDGKLPWAWIAERGYSYRFAGENLAVHFIDSSDVVEAWMASPSHRENIVKPLYEEIGVGVAQGKYKGASATFVVQLFGTPRAEGAVLGAAAAAASAPPSGFFDPLIKSVGRIFAEPQASTALILSGVAMLLLLAIVLTFFVHIQVQPGDLLLRGSLVALFALGLLFINARVPTSLFDDSSQAAAVGAAIDHTPRGVVVGEGGMSTERFIVEY